MNKFELFIPPKVYDVVVAEAKMLRRKKWFESERGKDFIETINWLRSFS